jgi:hypothetical protein
MACRLLDMMLSLISANRHSKASVLHILHHHTRVYFHSPIHPKEPLPRRQNYAYSPTNQFRPSIFLSNLKASKPHP